MQKKKSIASGSKKGSISILILKALTTGDKYGYEIMKEIKEKSGGEYVLKEPSVYSALRRMKQAELVTDYWEDSDIGGKRHFYNITQKGLEKLGNSNFEWPEFVSSIFSDQKKEASPSATSSSETNTQEAVQEDSSLDDEEFENIKKTIASDKQDTKENTESSASLADINHTQDTKEAEQSYQDIKKETKPSEFHNKSSNDSLDDKPEKTDKDSTIAGQDNQDDLPDDNEVAEIMEGLLAESEETKPEPQSPINPNDTSKQDINKTLKPSNKTKNKDKSKESKYTPPVRTQTYPKTATQSIDKNKTTDSLSKKTSSVSKSYNPDLIKPFYSTGFEQKEHKEKTAKKSSFQTTRYVSINKINFSTNSLISMLMLMQLIASYIILTNNNLLHDSSPVTFILGGLIAIAIFTFSFVLVVLNPNKKELVSFNILHKFTNNVLTFLILTTFIISINFFIGMNVHNTIDYIDTWFIPILLAFNLLLVPIIKFVLLGLKKYYM